MMRKIFALGATALLLFIWSGQTATAKDIVLNNGFEMTDILYWVEWGGTIPPSDRGVKLYDVTGDGTDTYCYWTIPWDNGSGGIWQNIPVISGVTYTVTADFCYHNC